MKSCNRCLKCDTWKKVFYTFGMIFHLTWVKSMQERVIGSTFLRIWKFRMYFYTNKEKEL